MSKPDGGPAFPERHGNVPGMSLRDYFAAAVLSSLIGSKVWEEITLGMENEKVPPGTAKACYQMADAMLAERAK